MPDVSIEIIRITLSLPNGDRDRERHKAYLYSVELTKNRKDGKSKCVVNTFSQEDRFYSSIRDGAKVRKELMEYVAALVEVLDCPVTMMDLVIESTETTSMRFVPVEFDPSEIEKFQGS